MKHELRYKTRLLPVLFFSLFALASLLGGHKAIAGEESIKKYQPSSCLVIQRKSRYGVIASKGRFVVTEQTSIVDRKNREIKIQKLLVPCRAQIDYQPSTQGDPVALKIIVKEVFPGASAKWTVPSPE